MHLFIAGIFPEDCSLKELMTFEDSLLDAEAAHHNCFIAESKFKNAGKGLFAKTCMGLYSVPPTQQQKGNVTYTFIFCVCIFFFSFTKGYPDPILWGAMLAQGQPTRPNRANYSPAWCGSWLE